MASEKFVRINTDQDPVELLKLIRSIAHKHEDNKGGTMACAVHNLCLYLCYQKPNVSNAEYYKTFKAIRAVVDLHGGRAGFHEGIFKEKIQEIKKENGQVPGDTATDKIKEKALLVVCDKYFGCLFLRNADDKHYKDLKRILDNANLF